MNAFFSSTDDANENMTQFYAVWGKVENEKPQFAFRYVVGNTKIECDPSVLIDWPHFETKTVKTHTLFSDPTLALEESSHETVEVTNSIYSGPFNQIEYPEDWFIQHKKAYSYANYQKNTISPYAKNYAGTYGQHYGKSSLNEPLDAFDDKWEDYYIDDMEDNTWADRYDYGNTAKKLNAQQGREGYLSETDREFLLSQENTLKKEYLKIETQDKKEISDELFEELAYMLQDYCFTEPENQFDIFLK